MIVPVIVPTTPKMKMKPFFASLGTPMFCQSIAVSIIEGAMRESDDMHSAPAKEMNKLR